jgi:hypothetical protein
MKAAVTAAGWLACLMSGAAFAGDEFSAVGVVDLRWVHATGVTSYLNGGQGILRFDPSHEDLQLGRAFIAPRLRVSDIVSLHAVIDTYADHDRNPVDLSEFWAEVRPFPTSPMRWHARVGAFHMPVSLENRGAGWSDVYSITPSALNTWIGEEFRTIGAEVGARWLGASSEYLGDFGFVAAVYGWNDDAGALLADRGFALTDRPSTLFGGVGRPPITFYHEIDHNPGYYTGLVWRHHDRLEVRVLHYDNRADTTDSTLAGGSAWHTRFSSVGARWEPSLHWTFIAQYLDGSTAVGDDDEYDQLHMKYHAAYGLASFDWGPDRLTLRFDHFGTHQTSGSSEPLHDQTGHAWTAALSQDLGGDWQAVAEWIRATSWFPLRTEYGIDPSQVESQLQIAIRYRFGISR